MAVRRVPFGLKSLQAFKSLPTRIPFDTIIESSNSFMSYSQSADFGRYCEASGGLEQPRKSLRPDSSSLKHAKFQPPSSEIEAVVREHSNGHWTDTILGFSFIKLHERIHLWRDSFWRDLILRTFERKDTFWQPTKSLKSTKSLYV